MASHAASLRCIADFFWRRRKVMPFEVLERKIESLPQNARVEIYHYVDYICSIYMKDKKSKKDTSFIDDMFGMMSHDEAEEMREHCHLHFKETV